ncbi:MAG: N-acetylmuramoyl-L-alanine amidase [Desulfatiglans sp.]|nr:N-acetylmuramoyl-L-alanine amidase [Desulfatiglans sp.]
MKAKTLSIIFIFMTILACLILVATEVPVRAAKTPATLLKQADQYRKSLYGSHEKKKFRHNWLNSVRRYERLYRQYPKTNEAAWALYHVGGLYTGLHRYSGLSKDLDEAIVYYKKVVESYESHRLADDAQFKIAEILYKYKKDPAQAYVEFLKVDIKFPSGDMRPKARKMLDKLALILSEMDDAGRMANGASRSGMVAVKDIRHWSTQNYTRVVIDLEDRVTYEHHVLKADPDRKKPRRLYLDLKKARATSDIDSALPIKDGLLKRARAGQYSKDTVRVVLDIESIGGYKVFHLNDPFRIVVDVRRAENGATQKSVKSNGRSNRQVVRKGVKRADEPDHQASLARQLGLNVKRIVIDPGHGGKDPGCFLKGGIKEKDIVLNIAKQLAAKIRKRIGCEVILTRTKDVFLSLESRTAIANMKKADLFVSLHVNAHRSSKIWGLETYFLNMATDERSMMVAARENATSQKNISDLQTILNSLMLNTKINESNRLARKVQGGMISRVKASPYKQVNNLGVKQAPFYVLIGADMPSILVETGFLTNSRERKRLLNKTYQNHLAEGICTGIHAYIKSIDQVYKGG